ncbi:MAG: hypothetical protein HYZ91_04375 [Candidatus Omnitrophica bacterium]|nr:hypothetical protein [Candidatus Omnitrophota bacterium]
MRIVGIGTVVICVVLSRAQGPALVAAEAPPGNTTDAPAVSSLEKTDAKPQHARAATPEEPGTVVHTFPDEAGVEAFSNIWQQRQAIMTRMMVLNAYWDQERAELGRVNQQLLSEYHLDVGKHYTLDPKRKVLLESPAAPPTAPAQAGQEASPPAPAGAPSDKP